MKRPYTLFQQYIASILLIGLLLQSCSISSNRMNHAPMKTEIHSDSEDEDDSAEYTLGVKFYKEGKLGKSIQYLQKAKDANHPKASKYIELINCHHQLQDSKIAKKAFEKLKANSCEVIENQLHEIESGIKNNTLSSVGQPTVINQTLHDSLTKQQKILVEDLAAIQSVAEDTKTSNQWGENATIPIVGSFDALVQSPLDAVNKTYQGQNKNIPRTTHPAPPSTLLTTASPVPDKDDDIEPKIDRDQDIEKVNVFLSAIAQKNEDSLTQEERKKLCEVTTLLQKEIKEVNKVAYNDKGKPVVVLLGGTGAGKSTLIHWLTGKKMFSIQDPTISPSYSENDKYHYIFSDTSDGTAGELTEISAGHTSKTSTPKFYPSTKAEGWIYVDCPGFHDTRGTLQKIKNALYIQTLLQDRPLVKFLFVMPASLFDVNRGKDVKEALNNLKSMFTHHDHLKNNISLVVTHHRRDIDRSVDNIKNSFSSLAAIERDETLKSLLNGFIEGKNKITLFSRPSTLGLYQNNEEKILVLDSIKNTSFLSPNSNHGVNIALPNDARLLINTMSTSLEKNLQELITKHIVEKIQAYFNQKIQSIKSNVDNLVDSCMAYYTPAMLVFGHSEESKRALEGTPIERTSKFYQETPFWIFGGSIAATMRLLYDSPATLETTMKTAFQTLKRACGFSPISTGIMATGTCISIAVYYIKKNKWEQDVRNRFIEKEAREITSEISDFSLKLEELRDKLFSSDFLKNENFLKNINVAFPALNITKIKETVGLLDSLSRLSNKDLGLFSKELWNSTFLKVTEHLTRRFFQTPYALHRNISAPDQMALTPSLDYCAHLIKGHEKLSHIPKEFIHYLLGKYVETENDNKNFSLSTLPNKKLKSLIRAMEFCRHIYTDTATKDFVTSHMVPTMSKKWQSIINQKNEIDRLWNNLVTIRKEWDKISIQSPTYESQGKYSSRQVLALPRSAQRPKYQEDYTCCIKEINNYLENTLHCNAINHKEVENIGSALDELKKVQQNIHQEFSWYFAKEQQEASIPPFIDTKDNNKKYPLTSEAVVTASFLHKTQLPLDSISILSVGFRNLEKTTGLSNSFRRLLLSSKNNPTALFHGRGEVDYIAYLKKNQSKKQDKLVIIYSGSNSGEDWVKDTQIGHAPCLNLSIHQGISELFSNSIDNYGSLLIEKLKSHYSNHQKPEQFKIITTGHSLGGGLALLAAYHYKKRGIEALSNLLEISQDKIFVKTSIFGTPAILDESSQISVEQTLGKKNIVRVCTSDDLVVYLSNKIHWHAGNHLLLCNIANRKFDMLDKCWGPHLAERYLCYLKELEDPSYESHQELISILKRPMEMIDMHRMLINKRTIQNKV